MDWRDEGVLMSVRRHGESAAIIEVLTAEHGRHAGVVRGGASRKIAPILQPGAQVDVTWRARLEEHLGSFAVEPVKSRADLLSDRVTLSGLNAVTALLVFALPEREAHRGLYRRTVALLDLMGENVLWPLAYVRWEVSLLEEVGFALDLERCAVTGSADDLAFVSPRTGRAVSRGAAGEWKEKLLPLSPALTGEGEGARDEILDALRVTGHFLSTGLAQSLGNRPVPEARARLVDRLAKTL